MAKKKRITSAFLLPEGREDVTLASVIENEEKEEIVRGTSEYTKGRKAYLSDPEPIEICPYAGGPARMWWWLGFLDQRIVSRLGQSFENWDGVEVAA